MGWLTRPGDGEVGMRTLSTTVAAEEDEIRPPIITARDCDLEL